MVDNKNKTSLIRHIQKNISLMKINNIILVLCTAVILSSSLIFFLYMLFRRLFYDSHCIAVTAIEPSEFNQVVSPQIPADIHYLLHLLLKLILVRE